MKRNLAAVVLSLLLLLSLSLSKQSAKAEELLKLPPDKVLRISPASIEFEHHGILAIKEEVKVYHHWENEKWSVPLAAVLVGFDEVVATLEQGKISQLDVYDPLYIRTMQVALSTADFTGLEHRELSISPTSQLYVEEKGTGRGFVLNEGQEVVIRAVNGNLQAIDGQNNEWVFARRLYIWPSNNGLIQINSFQRGTGTKFYPQYPGRLELSVVDGDRFLVINEVDLEEYLYRVVPSEMPISWPFESLKAQAVAARTYAVAQVIYSRQGHLGFHVSDNTNSQVYNNHPLAEPATAAIKATAGEILVNNDDTIGSTYYYSTSARARLEDIGAWQDKNELALEGNSPWYRWQCTFSKEELETLLQGKIAPIGSLTNLIVEKRDERGRVVALGIEGTLGKAVLEGELNIRSILRPTALARVNDTLTGPSLLPSACFFLAPQYNSAGQLTQVTVYGGGSGHGLGMSQWGAKGMAEAGFDYRSILAEYYPDTKLITHSEQLRY